ncbi:MAG: hypothetical protein L0H55_02170 [Candidatus Nitrosocosmicus sp.]|nr:hypothetical protein [Candidatus Nitrosocosmicus sp.]
MIIGIKNSIFVYVDIRARTAWDNLSINSLAIMFSFPIMLLATFAFTLSMVNATLDERDVIELSNYTSSKSLKVVIEYPKSNQTVVENNNLYFRLLFVDPNTDKLQRHVDYDFVILDDEREIYRLSNESGMPLFPMHSSSGIGVVPNPLLSVEKGQITIKVIVFGISFIPIIPEHVQFHPFVMS